MYMPFFFNAALMSCWIMRNRPVKAVLETGQPDLRSAAKNIPHHCKFVWCQAVHSVVGLTM